MTHGYEFFEFDYVDIDFGFDWDDFVEGYGECEIIEEWTEIEDVYDDIWRSLW